MARPGSIEALQERLAAIPVEVREAMKKPLEKSAIELQAAMRQLAPEDTGDLKRSIQITMPGETTPPYSQPGGSRKAGELEVLITAGDHATRYAHLVEYGTADAAAQPFFWPAFRLLRRRIENRLKRAMRKAVRDAFMGQKSAGDAE